MTTPTKKISIKPLAHIKEHYETPHERELDATDIDHVQQEMVEAEQKLESLYEQQEEIRIQTTKEVEQLKLDWQEERAHLTKEAEKAGYTDGYNHAEQEAWEQYAHKISEANTLIETAEKEYYKRIEEATYSVIELSVQIAEKIIHTHMHGNEDAFLSFVKGAIEELKEQPEINIYVPSEQYEFMLLQKDEIVEMMHGKAIVSFYIAPENTCYITHPLGKVDISIDTQLTEMRKKLLEIAMENQL